MGTTFYRVTTWDADLQRFTPQEGARCRHLSAAQLRRVLRVLQDMGYQAGEGDPFVLVGRDAHPLARREDVRP